MFNINASVDDNHEFKILANRIELLYDYVRDALHMMDRHKFHMRLEDLDQACIRYNIMVKCSKDPDNQRKDLILPIVDTIFGRYILGVNNHLYDYVTDRYPHLIDTIIRSDVIKG